MKDSDLGFLMVQARAVNRMYRTRQITSEQKDRWLKELTRPRGFWESFFDWWAGR